MPLETELISPHPNQKTATKHVRSLVLRRDPHDTIRINLERHLDLRYATRRRWDTRQLERSKEVVVLCHCTFTFEYLDEDGGLIIGGGAEDLGLLGGDDSVAGDELCEDTT